MQFGGKTAGLVNYRRCVSLEAILYYNKSTATGEKRGGRPRIRWLGGMDENTASFLSIYFFYF